MIARRPRFLLLLASAGLVSLLPALTSSVSATPDIAKATGQPCATCHVNPAGGGPRNALGMRFEALPNHDTDPAAAFASLTGAPAPAAPAPAMPTPAAAAQPGPTSFQPTLSEVMMEYA